MSGGGPLRVIFVVPWADRLGGGERRLWTILRLLDRERFEPRIVFLEDGPWVAEAATLAIETSVVPTGRLREVRVFRQAVGTLAGMLERDPPDLLVNWSVTAQLYGGAAARRAGLGSRTIWWQLNLPRPDIFDRLATLLPAKAVGCSSDAVARAQGTVRPRRPTFVVHPGIVDPPRSTPQELLELRQVLRIDDGAMVIGIVGRLQAWKRQHLVIETVAELRARGRSVHGLVVGGDAHGLAPDYARSLEALARDLGVSGAVTFTGHVSDPSPYVQSMDVLVNASADEPFGIVLLEAMALGTPVVAFDRAGPGEIVEAGESGVLIRGDGRDALVHGIEPLLDDPSLRAALSDRARSRYEHEFTADRMMSELQHEFERLAGR